MTIQPRADVQIDPAAPTLRQVIAANGQEPPKRIGHPIEVMAQAYGL